MRICVPVVCCSLVAQIPCAAAKPLRLDLRRVEALAQARAPVVLRAHLDSRVARSMGALEAAGARLTPRLGLQAGPCFGTGFTGCAQVSLSFPLPIPGESGAARRLGSFRSDAGFRQGRAAAWSARLRGALAYLRAVAARERVRLARSAEQIAVRIQRATDLRARAGDLARLDSVQAAMRVVRRQRQREAAQRQERAAFDAVRRLLLYPGQSFVLGESLDVATKQALGRARAGAPVSEDPRLVLAVARARVHDARARLVAKRRSWPRLALSATFQRDVDSHIFTVGVSIPFSPLSSVTRASADLAFARALRARRSAKILTRELSLARSAARARMRRSKRIRLLARRQRARAKELVALVLRGYRLGQSDLLRLLSAEEALVRSRRDEVAASLDLAEAAILVAAGGAS